jgi:hypothetical protein
VLTTLVRGLSLENNSAREPIVTLPAKKDESIVVAVHRPRTGRNLAELDKLPVTRILVSEAEVIPNSGRNIETGSLIQIGSWTFVAKHVLPVIGAERSTIFPLGITNPISVSDCDPSAFKDSLPITYERLLKPGNNLAGRGRKDSDVEQS